MIATFDMIEGVSFRNWSGWRAEKELQSSPTKCKLIVICESQDHAQNVKTILDYCDKETLNANRT